MTEKIPYWKSSGALQAFFPRTGEEGCRLCTDDSIRLSLDRAPPPMRDAPRVAKPPAKPKRDKPEDIIDKTMNVVEAIATGVENWQKFQKWISTPAPVAQPKVLKTATSKIEMHREPFDIQDIPVTVRRLGMWQAAKIFEKWFEGDLNYSISNDDANKEINHLGKPYPSSMIDKTSIKIDWILKFSRAKIARDELVTNSYLTTTHSTEMLRNILRRNTAEACLKPWSWCGEDIQKLHHEFQFQRFDVDGTLSQKLSQLGKQLVTSRGLPDELTMILGSFSLYAAISRAVIFYEGSRKVANITHIYVYARDGFTFNDAKDKVSQYLGHWNRQTLAIIPAQAALQVLADKEWIDGPVYQDPLRANFNVLYPVKNSDFRNWQAKHKRGGDFIIYTDRQPVRLETPIRVTLD